MRPLHVRVVSTLLMFSAAIPIALAQPNDAQIAPYERKFAQSKVVVEKVVKQLQASASGRLPVLDGFTRPGDLPLDRFQRGYYQCEIQVSSTSSGGALVRVSAKITAWYADPASSNSDTRCCLPTVDWRTIFWIGFRMRSTARQPPPLQWSRPLRELWWHPRNLRLPTLQ